MIKSVSIIVPVYQVETYIQRALKSLKKQTLKDKEVFLVDDGSQDGSSRFCEEFASINEYSIVIHQQNCGISSTRNHALCLASGTYCGFLDSDDYAEPEMFEFLYHKAKQEDADLVIAGYNEIWPWKPEGEKIKTGINKNTIEQQKNNWKQYLLESYITGKFTAAGYAWNKLYKTALVQEYGIYFPDSVQLVEDTFFLLNFLPYVNKVGICETYLYNYMRRNDSICGRVKKDFPTYIKLLHYEFLKKIEYIFYYDPLKKGKLIRCNSENTLHWIGRLLETIFKSESNLFSVWNLSQVFEDKNTFQYLRDDLRKQKVKHKDFVEFCFIKDLPLLLFIYGSIRFWLWRQLRRLLKNAVGGNRP